jgi:DNA ligase 1
VAGAGAVHPVEDPGTSPDAPGGSEGSASRGEEAPFSTLAALLEEIRTTPATSAKRSLLARYLATLAPSDLRWACTFLSGVPLPLAEPSPGVGGAAIVDVLRDLTKASDEDFRSAYLARGDLGEAAADLLSRYPPPVSLFPQRLTLAALGGAFRAMAAAQGPRSRRTKMEALRALLLSATPLEAKYLIKILTSDLRIGLREGFLLGALAEAFGRPQEAVRRTALLVGDPAEVALRARQGTLDEATLVVGRPAGFMLASALTDPSEAFALAPPPLLVEDKYDGVRVQAHRDGDRVVLFSRTLEDVTATFPELRGPLTALGRAYIVDGEVVAWQGTRALPFARLQQRLQRRHPGKIAREIPVVLIVFDILHRDGRDLLEHPLRERRAILESLP